MLSADLQALADRLARYRDSGLEMTPLAVTAIVAVLSDLAEQARALEGRPVPRPALADLPPGVADLAAYRRGRAGL